MQAGPSGPATALSGCGDSRYDPDAAMTQSALRTFLEDPARPEGTLRYHELQGFLFAIACSPDLVPPSEWMPIVFDEKEPGYDSIEQANTMLAALMELYNAVVAESRGPEPQLLPDCTFREDPLTNLEHDSAVSQWARGFVTGHGWLAESWDPFVPEEVEEEFDAALMVLSFFGSRQLAESLRAEMRSDLPSLAADVCRLFPEALAEYSSLGRAIEEALSTTEPVPPRRKPRIGRNDPCPCGSGKKYKKCCGVPH
jgi:uncharacterized protein